MKNWSLIAFAILSKRWNLLFQPSEVKEIYQLFSFEQWSAKRSAYCAIGDGSDSGFLAPTLKLGTTHTFKVNDMDRGKKRKFGGSRSSLIQFIPNWEVTDKPVFRKRKD